MINSNPETVSTDYDTSDLLFFEPLTHEDVLNVCQRLNGGDFVGVVYVRNPFQVTRSERQTLNCHWHWVRKMHRRQSLL